MSISTIIAITVIVVLSVIAVFIAEEPLDEVFHLDAAMQGFPVQPLATKVTLHQQSEVRQTVVKTVSASETAQPNASENDDLQRLIVRAA